MELLQVWDISEGEAKKEQVVEGQGHRTDARAMAISNDDSLLISASGDQVSVCNANCCLSRPCRLSNCQGGAHLQVTPVHLVRWPSKNWRMGCLPLPLMTASDYSE